MAEYTKIETARTIICDFCNQLYSDEPCEPADCDWLRMLEEDAADVAPVRHAKWEIVVGSNGKEYMVCTGCRKQQDLTGVFSYCPNCGAKMDEKENDNATY